MIFSTTDFVILGVLLAATVATWVLVLRGPKR
jgi:hypothetical protein